MTWSQTMPLTCTVGRTSVDTVAGTVASTGAVSALAAAGASTRPLAINAPIASVVPNRSPDAFLFPRKSRRTPMCSLPKFSALDECSPVPQTLHPPAFANPFTEDGLCATIARIPESMWVV